MFRAKKHNATGMHGFQRGFLCFIAIFLLFWPNQQSNLTFLSGSTCHKLRFCLTNCIGQTNFSRFFESGGFLSTLRSWVGLFRRCWPSPQPSIRGKGSKTGSAVGPCPSPCQRERERERESAKTAALFHRKNRSNAHGLCAASYVNRSCQDWRAGLRRSGAGRFRFAQSASACRPAQAGHHRTAPGACCRWRCR